MGKGVSPRRPSMHYNEVLWRRRTAQESPEEDQMAELIDIRKVAIGPKFLTARIRLDEAAPLVTSEDPEGTARVLELLPQIADHACLGDAGPLFGDAIEDTEVAHLFEHVTIELMARSGLAGDITSGRTKACVDEDRAFEVRILCPDDVLAAGALSSAAFILGWAYSGGGEPKPAIDAIIDGLVSIVESVTKEEATAPATAPEPEPVPEPEPAAEPEPEDVDLTGATIMMTTLPDQDEEPMRAAEPAVPAPEDEPAPEPRRSTLVMVAGPGVDAYVADPDPVPAPAPVPTEEANPQPIMVAGPKRGM